ncbi:MAG TPA: translocation/assembly module TamB domain-containing protein [Candidatus Avisuccinivibrio pullicola]|nr:translocation/assembly module TamB domain-containing protein [Candidatus Avisuccinivibrio pullicola]
MRPWLRKTLKITGGVLLGLLLVMAGTLTWLLGSTSGARFAASTASDLLKGTLTLSLDIQGGTLWSGLDTGKVEVTVPDVVSVTADSLSLHYALEELILRNVFEVAKLHSEKLRVTLLVKDDGSDAEPDAPATEDNAPPFRLNFPVDIRIHDFKVHDFAYLSEIVDVTVEDFGAYLQAAADTTLMREGRAVRPLVHLKLHSDAVEAQEAYAGAAADSVPAPQTDAVASESAAAHSAENALNTVTDFDDGGGIIALMPVVDLPLDITVLGLDLQEARYYMDGFDTGRADLFLAASWQHTRLSVLKLSAAHEMGSFEIAGTMDFTGHFGMDFKVRGEGALNEFNRSHYEGLLYGLKGEAQVKGDLVDLRADATFINPDKTTLMARINCLSPSVPLEVHLNSDYLRWPLFTDTALAEVSGLRFDSVGTIFGALKTSFDGTFSGYGFENYNAGFKGAVSLDKTEIEELTLSGRYAGEDVDLSAQGEVTYAQQLGYTGSLRARTSDALFVSQALRGPLSLNVPYLKVALFPDVSTELSPVNVDFDVPALNAALYLNGIPSTFSLQEARGSLKDGFDVGELAFVQGENSVRGGGRVVPHDSSLTLTATLPRLESLVTGLQGEVSAELKVLGALKDLDVTLSGRVNRLRSGELRVRELILDARTHTGEQNFEVTAIASNFRPSASLPMARQCILDFSGDLAHHSLNANCDGSTRGFIALSGGLNDNQEWQGTLEEFFASSPLSGSISLEESLPLSYALSTGEGQAGAFSLRGDNGRLNVDATSFGPGTLITGLNFKDYDLKSLSDLLPEDVNMRGPLSMDLKVRITEGVPDITLNMDSSDTRIMAYGVPLMFDAVRVKGKVTERSLDLNSQLHLRREQGAVNLNLTVSEPLTARRLGGSLKLENFNLALLTGVGSQFNDLQGKATLDSTLSGTLSAPLLHGTFKATGSAEPRFDVGQVDNFDVALNLNGTSGDLLGTITLNGGEVLLDGLLNFATGAKGELDVTAEKLPVFLMGFGQAHASVDTHVSFADGFAVTGEVSVPDARIRVNNIIDSGAQPSGDEILVPEGGTQELISNISPPVPATVDLKVALGEDVQLSAMGLDARLVGGLDVKKARSEHDIKGYGEVRIVDGRADLFGHHFIVNRARTAFDGPIADPRLDVEIVADPEDMEDEVTAGVRVTGTASDPRIALFSEPAMSDNEVLSYILYGHGLDKNTSLNQSSTNSSQMLLGLGLGSTTGLVNALVGAFGVQDVSFNATGSGDETQVAVQGYLTRKIRISYGYGVFNAVGEFKLRYEFMRRLYAEFVSSVDQAADLIYSFEFD